MSEAKKEKTPSLEENFSSLEDIITQLESQEITLDQSFALYQSGVKALKNCSNLIDEVEKKMQVLNEEGELEEFS